MEAHVSVAVTLAGLGPVLLDLTLLSQTVEVQATHG